MEILIVLLVIAALGATIVFIAYLIDHTMSSTVTMIMAAISTILIVLCIWWIKTFCLADKVDHREIHTFYSNEYKDIKFSSVKKITEHKVITKSWAAAPDSVEKVIIEDPKTGEIIVQENK